MMENLKKIKNNGKGKAYDIYGNLLYEGDFEGGIYYKEEKKDDKKHGKGIDYY